MATEDKRREFDEIVERLTTDYPALARRGQPWPRAVLISVLVTGGVVWGLLSIAMVAWGWKGVVLTCSVVSFVIGALVLDHRRRL